MPQRSRVARWFIFKPKVLIWVNFVGSCNERYWYILWLFGEHILRPFGIFVAVWYFCGPFSIFVAICYFCGRTTDYYFGIFYGHLVYFSYFGILYQEKSPLSVVQKSRCMYILSNVFIQIIGNQNADKMT
jgi:hypothetical protein